MDAADIDKIPMLRGKFLRYERVKASRRVDMRNRVGVMLAAHVDEEDYEFITRNYGLLREVFPEIVEKVRRDVGMGRIRRVRLR